MADFSVKTRISAPETLGKARRTVKFGSITITSPMLTAAELKHNVDSSTEALRRVKSKLTRAGVRIYEKKNVPLFYIDAENPEQITRRLNGRVERGILENGQFKVTD